MAATTITAVKLARNAASAFPVTSAVSANEGALITPTSADHKLVIVLENSVTNATNTAVVKAGNGLQGISGADLEVTIPASGRSVVVVESGRFLNVSGDDKGKILVIDKTTTSTAVKVGAIELP